MKPKNKLFILSLSTLLCTGVTVLSISDGAHFLFSKIDADAFSLTVDSNNVHASDFVDGHASFTAHNGTAHFEINNGEYLENGVTTLHEGGVIKKYFNSEYEQAYGLDAINVNYTSLGSGYVEVTTCYNQDFELTTTSGLGSSSTTHLGGNFYYIKAVGSDININSFTTTYGCFSESTPSSEPDPSDNKSDYHYDEDDLAGFEEFGDDTYYYVRGKIDEMNLIADNFELRGDSDESPVIVLSPVSCVNSGGYFKIYFDMTNFLNSEASSFNPHLFYKNKPFIAFSDKGDVRVEEGSGTATPDGSYAKVDSQYLRIAYWWGLPTIQKIDSVTVTEDESQRHLELEKISNEPYLSFTGVLNVSSAKIAEESRVVEALYPYFDMAKYDVWAASELERTFSYEAIANKKVRYHVRAKVITNNYDSTVENGYITHFPDAQHNLDWDFMQGESHVDTTSTITCKGIVYQLYKTSLWDWHDSCISLKATKLPESSLYECTYIEAVNNNGTPTYVVYGKYQEGKTAQDVLDAGWTLAGQYNAYRAPDWSWPLANLEAYEINVTDESKREFNVKFDLTGLTNTVASRDETYISMCVSCSINHSIKWDGNYDYVAISNLGFDIDKSVTVGNYTYRIYSKVGATDWSEFWGNVGLIITKNA